MSDLEMNKIAAAVLLAGVIGMTTSKVTDILYVTDAVAEVGHHDDEKVVRGYEIEVAEASDHAGGEEKPQGAPDITEMLAAADAAAGEAFFMKRCATCHTYETGAGNKIGPNLHGAFGRGKGALGDFKYSSAMAEKGGSWNEETLNQFLYKPKKWMPGTIMAYAGISKDQDRADVIAYLKSIK